MRIKQHHRPAFTLLEILVAVSIVAILIALLMPALSSARRNSKVAHVKKEIDSLADALEQFKAKYGEYPPSRITLYSTADGWNSDPRSKAIIRKYWPDFDFTSDGAGGSFLSDPVQLDGAECLTFFLGGVRDSDGSYIGFSNNPAQPFSVAHRDSRSGPFFRFEMSRVVDSDSDNFHGFIDPISENRDPYMYLAEGEGFQITSPSLQKEN